MSGPFTRKELDTMSCSNPDCNEVHGPLQLTGNCHPGYAVHALYDQQRGVLVLECAACSKTVTSLLIAGESPSSVGHKSVLPEA